MKFTVTSLTAFAEQAPTCPMRQIARIDSELATLAFSQTFVFSTCLRKYDLV